MENGDASMIRWCGFMALVAGAVLMGIGLSGNIRKTATLYRKVLLDLHELQRELEFHLTPAPELFRSITGDPRCVLSAVYTDIAEHMDTHPGDGASGAVEYALARHPLPKAVAELLREVLRGFGQQDAELQSRALSRVAAMAEQRLRGLEQEKKAKCRDCRVFCCCAGLAIAILLI